VNITSEELEKVYMQLATAPIVYASGTGIPEGYAHFISIPHKEAILSALSELRSLKFYNDKT